MAIDDDGVSVAPVGAMVGWDVSFDGSSDCA